MTVNELFRTSISTETEMEAWIKERRPDPEIKVPTNGEEMSLARVGRDLYEKVSKIFKSTGSNNHDAVISKYLRILCKLVTYQILTNASNFSNAAGTSDCLLANFTNKKIGDPYLLLTYKNISHA